MNPRKVLPVLIVFAGLLAFQNGLRNEFVFDDIPHIVESVHIRQLWPPWELLAHSSRPVVQLSLALNYAVGELNPWGFHVFNLFVHIMAALALYGVVRLTLCSEAVRDRWGESEACVAGIVSLIWLVHPLQTESVTYTIQRGESLAGLFYLLTLFCVIRSAGSSWSAWWRVAAVASCALGMGSKPIMATAPVVILFYDRAFLAKSWREVMKRRWVLYACLAATWFLLPVLLGNAPAEWKTSAGFGYTGISPLRYALTQPGAILHYLRLALWPSPLSLDYGWQYGWPVARSLAEAWPAFAVVGGLVVATVLAWRCAPALGFLGVWFFVILAPTSSFVPLADMVVEHRMYLPLAAVIMAVVAGALEMGRRFPDLRRLGWPLAIGSIVLLTILTMHRNRDYRSALTIWQDSVTKYPNNPRAHCNLGDALIRLGRAAEAIPHCEQAVRIKPDYALAFANWGSALAQAGRLEEAVERLARALQIQPDLPEAHFNLGRALLRMGRPTEAVDHLEQTIQLNAMDAEAHYELGNALLAAGRLPEAMQHWQRAAQIKPDFVDARNNLGAALAQSGRFPEAIDQLKAVLRITPLDAEVRANLGNVLLASGNRPEAIKHYEQALARARETGQAQLAAEIEARLKNLH